MEQNIEHVENRKINSSDQHDERNDINHVYVLKLIALLMLLLDPSGNRERPIDHNILQETIVNVFFSL